ncbi:hypothetical protein [Leeia oryzae]|uniref:hypothetical protein n=1 Tax=Leeia oryzae TaxID=356662 RepID=UPI000371A043|nr:hypothetical protein [Leeia oryzae]
MKKSLWLTIGLMLAGLAHAEEYQCKVYCTEPSGSTYVTVEADSDDDAAQIVDKASDQICQEAGFSASTSSTMSASQCQ